MVRDGKENVSPALLSKLLETKLKTATPDSTKNTKCANGQIMLKTSVPCTYYFVQSIFEKFQLLHALGWQYVNYSLYFELQSESESEDESKELSKESKAPKEEGKKTEDGTKKKNRKKRVICISLSYYRSLWYLYTILQVFLKGNLQFFSISFQQLLRFAEDILSKKRNTIQNSVRKGRVTSKDMVAKWVRLVSGSNLITETKR